MLLELLDENQELKEYTHVGVVSEMFDNDSDIKEKLNADTVGKVFADLKKEVEAYYEGN